MPHQPHNELSPTHSSDAGLIAPESFAASRRAFMLAGLSLFIAGCASSKQTVSLPGPYWPSRSMPPAEPPASAGLPSPDAILPALRRSQWANGDPVPSLMNPMLPVRYITVHHDGMAPFTATDVSSSMARLESIRRAHRGKGWGDIGYHFAVDRQGRIWEGRPLNWQGAHVKDHNEGNIGLVALGNFDRQSPTPQQLESLNRAVTLLMRRFNVPLKNVFTHQEWPGAATACPGVNLQRYMVAVRNNRQMG